MFVLFMVTFCFCFGSSKSADPSQVPEVMSHFKLSHQECQGGVFEDVANGTTFFGDLHRHPGSPPGCDSAGLGVNGPVPLSSTKNATDFIDHMYGKEALALELWIKPDVKDLEYIEKEDLFLHLLSIGNAVGLQDKSNPCTAVSPGNCNFGIEVVAEARTGEVSIVVSSAAGAGGPKGCYCFKLATSSPLINGESTHLFIVIATDFENNPTRPIKMSVYVNGMFDKSRNFAVPGAKPPSGYLWNTWGQDSFRLHLFSEHNASRSEVLGLVLYDDALSPEQVTGKFEAKVPNSLPLAVNVTVTVNEDGIRDPNNPAAHKGVSNTECAWVEVPMVDQDEDAAYPNYIAADRATRCMRVYLKNFPKKTAMYTYFDGVEITSENREISPMFENPSTRTVYTVGQAALLPASTLLIKSYRVRVRPAKDQFSSAMKDASNDNRGLIPFDSFSYYGVDGVTGEKSLNDGTLTLVVRPLNDPPIPHSLHVFVTAGEEVLIELNDTDVDTLLGEPIITKTPAHGTLQVVNSTFLKYKFTDWAFLPAGTIDVNVIALDGFEYKRVNVQGFNSTVAVNNTIAITTPVEVMLVSSPAQTNSNKIEEEGNIVVAYQGVTKEIVFKAIDYRRNDDVDHGGQRHQQLFLEILDLPKLNGTLTAASINGSAQSGTTRTPLLLDVGSMLPLEMDEFVVRLLYTPNKLGFSSPATAWDGSDLGSGGKRDVFRVRVVSLGAESIHSFYSVPLTQEVKVVNVNEPSMRVSQIIKGEQNVYAYSSLMENENPQFTTYLRVFEFVELSARGDDGDVDVVKVHLQCKGGGLLLVVPSQPSFSEQFGSEACAHGQPLQCTALNEPNGAPELVIVGPPSKIMKMLKGVFYRANKDNFQDTCSFTIFDGAGGNCVPLESLDARRDGTKTADQSGETSSYIDNPPSFDSDDVLAVSDGEVKCFETKIVIKVEVRDYAYIVTNKAKQGPSQPILEISIILACAVFVVTCLCCLFGCCRVPSVERNREGMGVNYEEVDTSSPTKKRNRNYRHDDEGAGFIYEEVDITSPTKKKKTTISDDWTYDIEVDMAVTGTEMDVLCSQADGTVPQSVVVRGGSVA